MKYKIKQQALPLLKIATYMLYNLVKSFINKAVGILTSNTGRKILRKTIISGVYTLVLFVFVFAVLLKTPPRNFDLPTIILLLSPMAVTAIRGIIDAYCE